MAMSIARLRELESQIPKCRRCPRLVRYLDRSAEKYPDYWARPVPGYGDRRAWLLVVGLAPGMHGANRTGKPFQGDAAGTWLYASLEALGVWNGRSLRGAYIVNAAKCVPPLNRPTGEELNRCRPWLQEELANLASVRVVLALGTVAQRAVLQSYGLGPLSSYAFGHGVRHRLPGRPDLLSSYHPSRQNTNTGRLTPAMWRGIWRRVAHYRPAASGSIAGSRSAHR